MKTSVNFVGTIDELRDLLNRFDNGDKLKLTCSFDVVKIDKPDINDETQEPDVVSIDANFYPSQTYGGKQ